LNPWKCSARIFRLHRGSRAFCVMIESHKMLYVFVFAAKRMVKGLPL